MEKLIRDYMKRLLYLKDKKLMILIRFLDKGELMKGYNVVQWENLFAVI